MGEFFGGPAVRRRTIIEQRVDQVSMVIRDNVTCVLRKKTCSVKRAQREYTRVTGGVDIN